MSFILITLNAFTLLFIVNNFLSFQGMGFRDNAYKCLDCFLRDRVQYVKVGSCFSEAQKVLSGVLLGIVLGTLLFLCFYSDLNNVPKFSHLSMYADDTKVYEGNTSIDYCRLLQEFIDEV